MSSHRRNPGLALSVLIAAALIPVAAGPATGAAAGRWRLQTPESTPHHASSYLDVAAVSASSAWAVGYADVPTKAVYAPLVAHWTGTTWQRVTPPSLSTGKYPRLTGVRATSAAGVWAIGGAKFPHRSQFNDYVSHRSGNRWVNHDLGAGAQLTDVRILGAHDVWALYTRETGTTKVGIGEHWNGRTWTKTQLPALPTFGGGSGRWQSAAAPGTGKLEMLHFNGTRWTVVAGPLITYSKKSAYYRSVLVRGSSVFVAVGYDLGEDGRAGTTLFERDAKGVWRQRLFLAKEYNSGLTRTSAPGLWLLSSDRAYGRLLHVVGGKVVSSSAPPAPPAVALGALSGTVHSATVFTAGSVNRSGFDTDLVATYRP